MSDDALDYHSTGRPGKIEVVPTKATATQRDLALAYTPGVAKPCLEIAREPSDVYKYTAKGNLVAVITKAPRSSASATSARLPASRSWKARASSASASPTSM